MAGRKKDKKKEFRNNRQPRTPRPTVCPFCAEDLAVDYKNHEFLVKMISDRGKIMSRSRTGVCAKHQRRVAQAVKRARHLALLPFSVGTR